MEEDVEELIEEHNLEAELAAKYDQLDPKLDAALEEELSHVVQKTGRGMDKGDEAPVDPSQRKLLKINQCGSFSNERFGRTATVIWKFLYDEPVLFWTNWPKEKKMLAWEMFQNPKKSFRFADPGFSFAPDSGYIVLGRESEIELRNPTHKRSRRNQKPITSESGNQNLEREEESKEMEKEKKCWGRVKRKGRIRKKKVNFENDFN
ncbi:hypothetical protein SLEP1_g58018 [Rubroshorea leprosula]|uniref:Uncharacterized protein n=1 Tax=Rubroshorea leprosula TaxID=152421 RepID=A0AAV5MMX0_9ROSI|nr:hypothetical protein SLEP1_g58018 [Rubroshorea leprosula]